LLNSLVVYATPSYSAEDKALKFNSAEETLKFLRSVVGIDLERYNVTLLRLSTYRPPIALSYEDGRLVEHPSRHYETLVKFLISDGAARFEAYVTFVDGRVQYYRLEGDFCGESALNLWDHLTIALKALKEYQEFTGLSHYTRLIDLLSRAIETKQLMIEEEDYILNITHVENSRLPYNCKRSTEVVYIAKVKGYKLPGDYFAISVSRNGFVTGLSDTSMYYVATMELRISEEEAIRVALPYAEEYARRYGLKIASMKAELMFGRDLDGRRGDEFAIYPKWTVLFIFDRVVNGVFGYAVSIWADTGEVFYHAPQGVRSCWSHGGQHAEINSESEVGNRLWLLTTSIVVALSTLLLAIYVKCRKTKRRTMNAYSKIRSCTCCSQSCFYSLFCHQ